MRLDQLFAKFPFARFGQQLLGELHHLRPGVARLETFRQAFSRFVRFRFFHLFFGFVHALLRIRLGLRGFCRVGSRFSGSRCRGFGRGGSGIRHGRRLGSLRRCVFGCIGLGCGRCRSRFCRRNCRFRRGCFGTRRRCFRIGCGSFRGRRGFRLLGLGPGPAWHHRHQQQETGCRDRSLLLIPGCPAQEGGGVAAGGVPKPYLGGNSHILVHRDIQSRIKLPGQGTGKSLDGITGAEVGVGHLVLENKKIKLCPNSNETLLLS